MRRYYAFEAEGVSEEVKTQLEKVEDVVEEKCETKADCEKILDKIDSEAEKFDDALKDMAGAAKDCKDGNCDSSEASAKIAPAAAELKNIAKSIGVASEGETLTEDDLKDSKAYLEGAREIVEAKMDEIEGGDGGDSDSGDDGDSKSDDNTAEDEADEAEAAESFLSECLEAFLNEQDIVMESNMIAMEGNNFDAMSAFSKVRGAMKAARKEMKQAVKDKKWRLAATKAKEIAGMGDRFVSLIDNMPQSVSSTVLTSLAIFVVTMIVSAIIGQNVAEKSESKSMSRYADTRKGIVDKRVAGAKAAAAKAVGPAPDSDVVNKKRDAYEYLKQNIEQQKKEGRTISDSMKQNLEKLKDEWKQAEKDNAAGGAARKKAFDEEFARQREKSNSSEELGKIHQETLKATAKAAGKVGRGMGAAAGGAAAAATMGASIPVVKFLKSKGAMNNDGDVDAKKLGPNDLNALLQALKASAKLIRGHYTKLANKYEKNANLINGPKKEDSTAVKLVGNDEKHGYESALGDDTISDFISACESMLISGEGRGSSFVPYLFD